MNEIITLQGPIKNNYILANDLLLRSSPELKGNNAMKTNSNQKNTEILFTREDLRHCSLLTVLEQLTERHKMKVSESKKEPNQR